MHSILTSSHHTAANQSRPRYKWCLQETAFVSVEGRPEVYRQSAAACVSLSKSTMSKTQAAGATSPFSARCRRRRLSSEPRIPCQIVFFKTFRQTRQPTRRSSAEPAASKETTKSSQAIISKRNISFPGSKYLEALANIFVFLGGRLLTKQNSRVNRPFHFCFFEGRSHFRTQKVTEARRFEAP